EGRGSGDHQANPPRGRQSEAAGDPAGQRGVAEAQGSPRAGAARQGPREPADAADARGARSGIAGSRPPAPRPRAGDRIAGDRSAEGAGRGGARPGSRAAVGGGPQPAARQDRRPERRGREADAPRKYEAGGAVRGGADDPRGEGGGTAEGRGGGEQSRLPGDRDDRLRQQRRAERHELPDSQREAAGSEHRPRSEAETPLRG